MIAATVIGWPITHSRSPLIHNYWLKQHNIDGAYTRVAVAPEDLQSYISGLRDGPCVGTNVTIPHKESAIAFIDETDERVRKTGSLNTIWRDSGRLLASSTDGQGFIANVLHTLPNFNIVENPITVLGAGGAARAIVDELLRSGASRIFIHNRTLARAEIISHQFGPKTSSISEAQLSTALSETGLLINTTATELEPQKRIQIPWDALNKNAVVADIVYTPLITPFLQTARARHHAIVPGLGMLLHQAVFGFEKWFGITPKVTQALYDLVEADIAQGLHT